MDARGRRRHLGWAVPWLLFQLFPIADLILTPRPAAVRVLAGVLLVVFTVPTSTSSAGSSGGAATPPGGRW